MDLGFTNENIPKTNMATSRVSQKSQDSYFEQAKSNELNSMGPFVDEFNNNTIIGEPF